MKTVVHLVIAYGAVMLCCCGEASGASKAGDNQTVASREQQVVQSVVPKTEQPKLHMAELLSYATVRLTCTKADGKCNATGFFYRFPYATNAGMHIPVIVSNRHVADGAIVTSGVITLADSNSLPSSATYAFKIDNRKFPWINHPDQNVELSVLPLAPVLRDMQKEGKMPFYFALSSAYIPDDECLKSVTQTDEVIMIGYPGGLWDEINNQPIFRKGILATSPRKNFCGRKEFLIDMPVYCGSSGSPVLLFSEGAFLDRSRGEGAKGVVLGDRLNLLGINYATITQTVTGAVALVPVPTVSACGAPVSQRFGVNGQNYALEANMGVPNNIGVIIHASRLKEIEEMFTNILRGHPTSE